MTPTELMFYGNARIQLGILQNMVKRKRDAAYKLVKKSNPDLTIIEWLSYFSFNPSFRTQEPE